MCPPHFFCVCMCACQVLVVFTDGLDEDVMKLEHQSELLRLSGEARMHMGLCVLLQTTATAKLYKNISCEFIFKT